MMPDATPANKGFHHLALFYRSSQEYLAALLAFVRASLAMAEPVFVAVPAPAGDLLRGSLGQAAEQVAFADMATLGRNPARIIPAVSAFVDAHRDRRVRYVGEPAWPARSADELRETARHEALINRAFTDAAATILCPYDSAELPSSVIADARRTHPLLLDRGARQDSPQYEGPDQLPPGCDSPLPAPPSRAAVLRYATSLRAIRDLVARQAALAGLTASRTADLVLAVSEIAANTLRYTRAGGTLHVWRTRDSLICQIHDQGRITDPLAGRRRPAIDVLGGQGLWVVNQVCDLVELRSGRFGTTIRMRMRLRQA
jgi:anti-sigma regulatory factor (Ser/Thr protein kinase)